jgi:hypothetical protein
MPHDGSARSLPGYGAATAAAPETVAPSASAWTDEQRETLRRMAAEGATGLEIGGAIGKSRNAVLGHCYRHGITLPLTARKLRMAGRRFKSTKAAHEHKPKFGPDHPARRSRAWGARVWSDGQIAAAIAARLAGASLPKAGGVIGASGQALTKWMTKPDLMAHGSALYERAKEDAARRRAQAEAVAQIAAATEAHRVWVNNAPILARMPPRDRIFCQRRIAGDTLKEIADDFHITRERVRQIEAHWRAVGLIVPGLRPLTDAARASFGPGSRREPKQGPPAGRQYRISDEERARRAAHMRAVAHKRWGIVVGGAPA